MKFSKPSQLFLVSSVGLLVATLLTSCSLVTIDYVFVASNGTKGTGQIQTYDVDSQSGALRTGAPEISSGGANPVALAATPDYSNLYVANAGSNSVVHFAIADNGVLTQKDSVVTSGAPVSIAVNAAGTYLYVVVTQQTAAISGATPTVKAQGTSGTVTTAVLSAYPLTSGTIGAASSSVVLTVPGFVSDKIIPTGVTSLANDSAVFVSAYDQSVYNPGGTVTCTSATSNCANPGWVFGFAVSGGTLTASNGSPWTAGVKPTAITSDPTSRFVYATDYASNQLIGYSVLDNSTLSFLLDGPFASGSQPDAITIDPRGKFIYIANSLSSSVSAYAITAQNGNPSPAINISGSSTNSTFADPVGVIVDPSLGRFVYTVNYLGDNISGFRLDPTAGSLTPTQATPYPTDHQPTALIAVPHGNHAIQLVAN